MIRAYLAERCRMVVFVPLAVLVAVGAAGGAYDLVRLMVDVLASLLLIAEFRLWDDLADRRSDAVTHPNRVLVKAPSPDLFICVGVALATVNLVTCLLRNGPGLSMAVLVLLHVALAVWYVRRSGRTMGGDQLLLAKYPAFVLVVAGSRLDASPWAIVLAAGGLYIAASAYEAWHDPVSPLATLLGGRL